MDQGAYYFVASDGRRGDIVRCQTCQPQITDENLYFFYMWVEALQGYFLLRQEFSEGRPQQWQLIGEIEVEERGPWVFDEITEELRGRLAEEGVPWPA